MKKAFVILSLVLGLSLAAAAQPKAAGLRKMTELSYQHYLGGDSFLEATFSYDWFTNFIGGAAIYNWVVYNPELTSRGEWAVYGGPGLAVGGADFRASNALESKHHFMIGGVLQAGLEYNFWFPLQLSVDVRPVFGIAADGFWNNGMLGFVPSFSVRYRF